MDALLMDLAQISRLLNGGAPEAGSVVERVRSKSPRACAFNAEYEQMSAGEVLQEFLKTGQSRGQPQLAGQALQLLCRTLGEPLDTTSLDDSDFRLWAEALEGVDLAGVNLSRGSLRGAKLIGCRLTGAILIGSDMTGVTISAADASDLTAPTAVWTGAVLAGVNFRFADLSDCVFEDCDLSDARWERAALTRARFFKCLLNDSSFEFADLRQAIFEACEGISASFIGADLQRAYVECSRLPEADFYWAELNGFFQSNCQFGGARWPSPTTVSYAPRNVSSPHIEAKPLYRVGTTPEERQKLSRSMR